MRITFILNEPAVPENIGAVARAIKTMGFNHLRLINPCQFLENEAQWLAHASVDILENAKVYKTLSEAIQDMDFVIGTSAKARSAKFDYYSIEEIPLILENKGNTIAEVAIVFGKEESGLSNEELQKCDLVSFIPMHVSYPSLNLSQAVMLYTYKLFLFERSIISNELEQTGTQEYSILKQKAKKILKKLQFVEGSNIYNRIFERLSVVNKDDTNLLNSIANKISKKLDI